MGAVLEWLGLEAGVYTDPYSNFGRLSYEMWRPAVGGRHRCHAKGWTRQQALDYLGSHTALPLHEVETEVDRYISWPGQALAYKLGELKIKECAGAPSRPGLALRPARLPRQGAGQRLRAARVLEKNVNAWIAARQGGEAVGR